MQPDTQSPHTVEQVTEAEKIIAFDKEDEIRLGLGLNTMREDALERARYLDGYADIIAKEMYRGERPSGIWNLERAAELLRRQVDLIDALRSRLTTAARQHSAPSQDALREAPWIVWSNEHRAFWAPNRCGYTQRIEKAGRYSQAEAEAICKNANYRANSTINVGTPPEICMPAPEALSLPVQDEGTVERVARAMADRVDLDWNALSETPDMACGHGMPEGCKSYWRDLARAALAALQQGAPR